MSTSNLEHAVKDALASGDVVAVQVHRAQGRIAVRPSDLLDALRRRGVDDAATSELEDAVNHLGGTAQSVLSLDDLRTRFRAWVRRRPGPPKQTIYELPAVLVPEWWPAATRSPERR
jgi:hypothetical protein